MKIFSIKTWLLASLTLGLAPFFPQPHLWGKLLWIAGGAEGMAVMDWFDVVLHGFPWVMLIVSIAQQGIKKTVK